MLNKLRASPVSHLSLLFYVQLVFRMVPAPFPQPRATFQSLRWRIWDPSPPFLLRRRVAFKQLLHILMIQYPFYGWWIREKVSRVTVRRRPQAGSMRRQRLHNIILRRFVLAAWVRVQFIIILLLKFKYGGVDEIMPTLTMFARTALTLSNDLVEMIAYKGPNSG
jgi:hypothetical protein